MQSNRKRRRQTCSRCGQSFSSSWVNQHRRVCISGSETPYHSVTTIDKSNTSQDSMDFEGCDEVESAQNTEHLDASIPDTSYDDDSVPGVNAVPSKIADLLRSRLESRRSMEEEDQDFFDTNVLTDEQESSQSPAPSTEIWNDLEDAEVDFEQLDDNNSTHVNSFDQANKSRLEVLVLWLMLFLTSWQSQHGITDTAITALIKFLCHFFWLIGMLDNSMSVLSKLFPKSQYKIKKILGIDDDDFIKYVVCPKCKSLYKYEDCFDRRSGQTVSAKCHYVPWPNHPHRSRRGSCGEFLLKAVRGREKTTFYPRMVYPYKSLIKSLQFLLNRKGFWKKCQEWRKKQVPSGCMSDVHHGRVWKELADNGFLSQMHSLALALNVDWFQPHKHSPGSIGVLYMVVLNLPREERYKIENVIVVGILPGPSEPKLTANSFLKPLVDELKHLWQNGERFSVSDSIFKKRIKVGLICVTCDIPASRKIGGFMGHMANQGCSRCKKQFYIHDHLDFSGFERDLWPPRTSNDHKASARDTLHEVSPTSQQAKCSEHGARYSVLHELDYFDCIRFFVIDPMHNLYLGTSKHMMKNIWQNNETPMFGDDDFKKMQERVDSMVTPHDIGRIPGKIAHSFSGFTADQWQNWTVIYSLYALTDILPHEHLECWRLFVKACKLLGKRVVTINDIEKGDDFLLEFLNKIQTLYGSHAVTPNMHLHCHLKDCMLDFGPFHGFWCFSFERYNGILGKYNTNNRSIEIQLMRRFLSHARSKVHDLPELFRKDFECFFEDVTSSGSVKTTMDPVHQLNYFSRQKNISLAEIALSDWSDVSIVQMLPPIKDFTLDDDDVRYLENVYSMLIDNDDNCKLDIPFTIEKYSNIMIGTTMYGSTISRTMRNAYILAKWAGYHGRIHDGVIKPGEVLFYFRHNIRVISLNPSVPDRVYTFYMARVNWYSHHPDQSSLGDTLEVWCNQFDSFGPASFLPVQRIRQRCVITEGKFAEEKVMIVTTLPGE